jgi:hypothetical protein
MFWAKLINSNTIIPKLPKTNNVPINVIVIVITWSQVIGKIMRYQEPLKVYGRKGWLKE